MNTVGWLVIIIIALAGGAAVGYFIKQRQITQIRQKEQEEAENIINKANEEARSVILQAKDKALETRQTADAEVSRRRNELSREEDRLQKRREDLDGRTDRHIRRFGPAMAPHSGPCVEALWH